MNDCTDCASIGGRFFCSVKNLNGKILSKMHSQESVLTYRHKTHDQDNSRGKKRVIVIGSGPVGMRFAKELLNKLPDIKLTIFSNEPCQPYNRAQLSVLLAGEISRDKIDIPLPDIEKHPNFSFVIASIKRIDKESKKIIDQLGNSYHYDILIIATGARAHVPNIEGVDLKGVYTFRNIKDTENLYARVTSARKVVVIGGGLLGLEAARGLAKFYTQVVVVHQGSHLMNRQLDKTASDKLIKKLSELGVTVVVDSGAREFISENNKVAAVKIRTGEIIPCDTVLLCTGIQPNVELARKAKIKVSRGIVVNDYLETSESNIYAIGECCEHRGITYGLLNPGYEQAELAAKGVFKLLIGEEKKENIKIKGEEKGEEEVGTKYAGSLTISRLKVLGENVCSMGNVVDLPKRPFQSEITYHKKSKNIYRKVAVYKGQIIGAAGFGVWPDVGRIQDAYRNEEHIRWWQKYYFKLFGSLWLIQKVQNIKDWPSNAIVCQCNGVSQGEIYNLISKGYEDMESLQNKTLAGSTCGSCKPLLASAMNQSQFSDNEKNWLLMGLGSLSVFIAISLLLLVPAQETAASVQGVSWFEKIWNDKFWKQISGFSLLGLTLIGLNMSLIKRAKLKKIGSFSLWRVMHIFIGLFCVFILILHTGFHVGNNLNFLLFINFISVLLVGVLTGLVLSFGNKFSAGSNLTLRKFTSWMHIFATWPLPVLLSVHILSVYYF